MRRRGRESGSVVTTRRVKEVVTARAELAAPRDAVYHVLWSPDTTRELWPEVTQHSVILPGTGPGPGEIHLQVQRSDDGLGLSGVIVEGCRPPEFVRYAALDIAPLTMVTEIHLDAMGPHATTVRWETVLGYPAGVPIDLMEKAIGQQRVFIETYLRGSGRILNAPIELDGVWRMT